MFTASEIAVAFNSVNERKQWEAKPNSRPESGLDVVNFKHKTGLINLTYNASDMRFSVKFNKVQAQWGDYILSIVRGLHHILTTLKKAGLPFEAPATPNGMEITATYGGDGNVYVSAVGDHHPVMPELSRGNVTLLSVDEAQHIDMAALHSDVLKLDVPGPDDPVFTSVGGDDAIVSNNPFATMDSLLPVGTVNGDGTKAWDGYRWLDIA